MRKDSSVRLVPRGRIAAASFALIMGATGIVMATGSGGTSTGFLLGGTAQLALDPENSANDVIKIDNASGALFGSVSRKLNVKITQLDNMLEFKSYFQNRSCGGGSPRIQLAVDLDGNGTADANAFGHVAPPFAGCAPNRWQNDDVTDELPRWDLSQLALVGFPAVGTICTLPLFMGNPAICPLQTHSGYIPWAAFETVLATLYPNHKICTGALIDDSGWFAPAAGTAYYDVISLGRMTWVDRGDGVTRGSAQGCGVQNNHDDDDHEGDCDRDHDYDDHDQDYDRKRRDRWGHD
jgi:hypothetical protein